MINLADWDGLCKTSIPVLRIASANLMIITSVHIILLSLSEGAEIVFSIICSRLRMCQCKCSEVGVLEFSSSKYLD